MFLPPINWYVVISPIPEDNPLNVAEIQSIHETYFFKKPILIF